MPKAVLFMSIPPSQYPEKFKEDIFVNFCHIKPEKNSEQLHYHDYHYEIAFILKGKTTYFFDLNKYELKENEVIFVNKKLPHLTVDDEKENCEKIIINFNDHFLKKSSLNFHFLTEIFASPIFSVPDEHSGDFVHLLTELVYESDYPSSFSSKIINGNVYKLLVTMYRIITKTQLNKVLPTNPIIEAATKYICKNFSENLTLEDVASKCHVNKCYLSKLFKSIMGVNFINYVNSIRIQNASKMLINSDMSIMEISEKCGFNSQNHFCEVFKNVKGVSAREFRKFN